MEIQLQGRKIQKERAMKLWRHWYAAHKAGMSIAQIARAHINENTGKHYTRAAVYLGIKNLKEQYDQSSE